MRELSLSERHTVGGAGLNVYIDVSPYYYSDPYFAPQAMLVYEPVWVPCTTTTPIYNQWGYMIGTQVEYGYCECYEPVYYYY